MSLLALALIPGCDLLDDLLSDGDDTGAEDDPMVRVDATCATEACDAVTLTATHDRLETASYTWVFDDGSRATGDTVEVAVDTASPTFASTLTASWDDGVSGDFVVDGRFDPTPSDESRVVIDAIWVWTAAQAGRCRFHHQAVAIDGSDGLSGCITGSEFAGFEYSPTGSAPCGATVSAGAPCVVVAKAPDSATASTVSRGQTGTNAVFRNVGASGYFDGSTSASFQMDVFPGGGSGWVFHDKYDASLTEVDASTTGFYPYNLACPAATKW